MENSGVELVYLDEDLRTLAADSEFRPEGWSEMDVREFHLLVQCTRAAYVEDDLRNMRVLRIEPCDPVDSSRARSTLSSGRVIGLTFNGSDNRGPVLFENLAAQMESRR